MMLDRMDIVEARIAEIVTMVEGLERLVETVLEHIRVYRHTH